MNVRTRSDNYADIKVFISGDTVLNKWFIEYGKGVDPANHESFQSPQQLVDFYNQPPQLASRAGCKFHASPPMFEQALSGIYVDVLKANRFSDRVNTITILAEIK